MIFLKRYLLFINWILFTLLSQQSFAVSVCQTEFTLLHEAQASCHQTPVVLGSDTFFLSSVLIKADHPSPDTRPTVIMIPGGPGEASDGFRGLMQEKEHLNSLWRHLKVNVIMFDPRGTGQSLLPDQTATSLNLTTQNMSFALLYTDLERLIDYHNLQKVTFLTHSIGALYALKFSEQHPQRVEGMILVAPLTSARGLGLINLQKHSKTFTLLDEHIQATSANPEYGQRLREAYNYIEDVIQQQTKARVLNLDKVTALRRLTPILLRNEFIRVMNDITTPSERLLTSLEIVKENFEKLENSGQTLVTDRLREAKITASDVNYDTTTSWKQIANHLICSETILPSEMITPLFYDGLIYQNRCPTTLDYNKTLADPMLDNIDTPTLIIAGDNDTQVPYYLQKIAHEKLKNSTLVLIEEGGHFPLIKSAYPTYKAMEEFLNQIAE